MAQKTGDAVSYTKLRHKLYNLNRSVEKKYGELGGIVFELLSQSKTGVYEDSNVKNMIGTIAHIKNEIKETEVVIENLGVEKEEQGSQ